jgi:wyosine [tRNA(Phe)-imidazoG37] synthetase (radical SAM superfamily)
MGTDKAGYAYGPVPSRRLGRSLGINTIPCKYCSYSCVYCQVGRTAQPVRDRRPFYDPKAIFQDVAGRLNQLAGKGETIDYLSIVPDGEPTLDSNLGRLIDLLRPLGLPIAVITNSSLLWRDDVRRELGRADWVSLKVDAVDDRTWRRINRPHHEVRLAVLLDGIRAFRQSFNNTLVTETMLVSGINDTEDCIRPVAAFLHELQPQRTYLSVPTRPPAESFVTAPDAATLNHKYHILADAQLAVETLIGSEGSAFTITDDISRDLLGITAVHPMRAEAIQTVLDKAGASWEVVERLLEQGDMTEVSYNGETFYLRRFAGTDESI